MKFAYKPCRSLLTIVALASCIVLSAQDAKKVVVSGSVQSDILFPQEDQAIGAIDYKEWALTNTYADVSLRSRYVDAGARFEFLQFPLPGFDEDGFKGWGIGNIYAKFHTKNFALTLGNFYEQFGSGFILRSYEERSLGLDNSLLGAHIAAKPFKGVSVKALSGFQRRYWSLNKSLISGADVELNFEEWLKTLQDNGTYLSLGASYVNKHEGDEDIMYDATHRLNLPKNVNSFDLRARLQKGGFNILAEYARKTQDPSSDNGYIYRNGYATMLSASYSQKGMSVLLQAKRSDNMTNRSRRSMIGLSSKLNFLPPFTTDHTYTLAALYPYATNPDGEWAYQAELAYNFKRKTPLGGKYGTNVKVNFSYIRSIEKNAIDGGVRGSDGYGSPFWKWGDTRYYQDFNIQLEKKISSAFKLNLMYMNQYYNKTAIEGEGGAVRSNIFIAEGKYTINRKFTLRGEAQYLATKDDEGDWIFGLLELSILPNWMVTVSDEYNCGKTKLHYYSALLTFSKGAHRIQAGYARTRGGFNCSGGVCREVKPSKGFSISYNYNF
ncbi:MAG: hypothetical protein J1F05_00285 [Muribaculaceae bacterium]|nr:hypothetical protein [Muribaculaceae bacterium]